MFRETDHLGDRPRHLIKAAVMLVALVGVYQVAAGRQRRRPCRPRRPRRLPLPHPAR